MSNNSSRNKMILFESSDDAISLNVQADENTVWLNQEQMSLLFDTIKQSISLHVNNCFREGELPKDSVVKESLTTVSDGKAYKVKYYNLDVIISVGYRVKSQHGIEFRRWATDVLRRYIIEGRAENERRLQQLSQTVALLERVADDLDTSQVLKIVRSYAISSRPPISMKMMDNQNCQ